MHLSSSHRFHDLLSGLPLELSNFQGYFECNKAAKIGRPASIADAQSLITMFDRVKAVGNGHSWWKEQFCPGNDSKSIGLVMTEIQSTLEL